MSPQRSASHRGSRSAVLATAVGACLALAACDVNPAAEAAEASASPPVGEYDPDAVEAMLLAYEPDLIGMEHITSGGPPVDTAEAYTAGTVIEVEPVACAPIYDAIELATDDDRGAAAGDLLRIVGNFSETGELPTSSEDLEDPHAFVLARAFEDPSLAEDLVAGALGAECDRFTASYPELGFNFSDHVAEIGMVSLAGVDGETLRIVLDERAGEEFDADGESLGTDPFPPTTYFVHVAGRYAVLVQATSVEDEEELAAGAISEFLDAVEAG